MERNVENGSNKSKVLLAIIQNTIPCTVQLNFKPAIIMIAGIQEKGGSDM